MKLKAILGGLAVVLAMPLLGAVTNEFGVCYLPERKAFELTFKNERTLFDGQSVDHRSTAKTITTRTLKRLNRHFYRTTIEGKTPGQEKEVVLFQYQRVQVQGGCLAVREGHKDVLYSNGKRFELFPHVFTQTGLHYLGDDRYLFQHVTPFAEYASSR